MPVCGLTLFLVHLVLIVPLNGAAPDEHYKGRRWSSAGGNGPYSLVVSADDHELRPEESIGYALVLQEKLMGKLKTGEDKLMDKSMDKYDKVTERLVLKESRKRQRLAADAAEEAVRKRRRPVTSSTTGQPQTMGYNLYNHFRPLEQGLPQDDILPFLDFGRKLSTGATPSGANLLEASTRRSTTTSTESVNTNENEDVSDDEMDVSVIAPAVERNYPPRATAKSRKPTAAAFYRRPEPALLRLASARAELKPVNRTETKHAHHDLQPNESGYKPQIVLSPNYGLRLNKSEGAPTTEAVPTVPSTTASSVEASKSPEVITPTTIISTTSPPITTDAIPVHLDPTVPKLSDAIAMKVTRNRTVNLDDSQEAASMRIVSANTTTTTVRSPVGNDDGGMSENKTVRAQEPLPQPSPTARILSTAVVTSVSVKESPRFSRVRSNLTSESTQPKTTKIELSQTVAAHNITDALAPPDNRTAILQNLARRKFTTFRPKTTSFRAVTFRSTFRRNSSYVPAVVHVVSTPPSYIEVPRILPVTRTRTTSQPQAAQHSEVVRRLRLQSENATLTMSNRTVSAESNYEPVSIRVVPPSDNRRIRLSSTARPTSSSTPQIDSFREEVPETATEPSHPDVEIEFRPLDETKITKPSTDLPVHPSPSGPATTIPASSNTNSTTTSPRPYNFTVPHIPDLLWVYGQRNNHSAVKTQPSTVGVAFHDSTWGVATYVLLALGMIPVALGALILVRQILLRSKKKVLDESEYSSEYNRSPLPTKLPRLPAHINWEEPKPAPALPVSSSVGTKWEFPRDKLRLQTVLGQGNFGQVWKAEADDISGHEGLTRLVAVKTVKEGASQREKEDLLRELGIMQELGAHPNVVTLLSCCTEKEPYLLIMEYVMYGKLLAFLREHRTRAHYFNFSDLSSALNSRDLTVFSYCVARGMEYLVSKGIIHRDLAARNILVDHNKLCKIADFGMSRNVRDTGEIYEQRPNRGALPIRWMAPESLHFNLFTHKSDVWSFGVLLWEIVTLGSTPYSTMGAREVMRKVLDGYRLDKPKHCKAEFFKVLTKCWHSDPTKRPTFTELKLEIGTLLGTSEAEGRFVDLEALAEEAMEQENH